MTYVVSFHKDWSAYFKELRGREFGMAEVTIPIDTCDTPGDISLYIRIQLAKDLRTNKESITILNFWQL